MEIVRLGTLHECRLWQYRSGGFFVKGESILTAGEDRYRSFIDFNGPFATVLERAVRQEIIAQLIDEYGHLSVENEFLDLDDAEYEEEIIEVPKPSFEDAIVIKPVKAKPLHGSLLTFDATVGGGITFKGLRLSGKPTEPRLLPPTSAGLSFRPYVLEEPLKYEILRRAQEYISRPPLLPTGSALTQ